MSRVELFEGHYPGANVQGMPRSQSSALPTVSKQVNNSVAFLKVFNCCIVCYLSV